jgi:cold shock CspA family protein
MPVFTGTVTRLHALGFGFIRSDDGRELFFASRLVDWDSPRRFNQFNVGDRVRFGTVVQGTRGARQLEAHHVRWLACSLATRLRRGRAA